jgi:hypothetical protein
MGNRQQNENVLTRMLDYAFVPGIEFEQQLKACWLERSPKNASGASLLSIDQQLQLIQVVFI